MQRIISGFIAQDGSIINGTQDFEVNVDYPEYHVTFTQPFVNHVNIAFSSVLASGLHLTLVNLRESSPSGFRAVVVTSDNQVFPLGYEFGFHFIAAGQ